MFRFSKSAATRSNEPHRLSLALVRGGLALVGVGLKRPAFQFYPGDWRKDVGLRACSLAARGLWIDLMAIMHECEPYGHLTLNGKPMSPAQIAGQVGNVTPSQVSKMLDELLANGVPRKTSEGVIYSKRMVDDERVRNARAEGGKAGSEHGSKGASHGIKGGRPTTSKGGFETPQETPLDGDLKPPPSSSSSSSSSNNTPLPPGGGADRFGEFWALWPRSTRKGGKAECEKLWAKLRLDSQSDAVLAHVKAMSETPDWLKENGAYIPAPAVYLRGKRWDGSELSESTDSVFAGGV